jgi:hypothetical protein
MAKLKIRTKDNKKEAPVEQDEYLQGIMSRANSGYNGSYYKSLRDQLTIDKDNLNEGIERQPQLYQEVGEKLSMVTSQRDAAKEKLARLDAELANNIRARAVKNKESMTVGEVKDAVSLHDDHIEASDKLAALEQEVSLWSVLRASFDQRMRMLREEVALFTTGYFQTAHVNGTRGRNRDSEAERAREKLQERRSSRGED